MNVIGHGIDIVEVAEVRRLVDDPGSHFVARYFTDAECGDAGDGVNRVERLAGRFAAKEAVVKALRLGWGDGIARTDVEIRTMESGAPDVMLYGRIAAVAGERGVSAWLIRTSHTEAHTAASSTEITLVLEHELDWAIDDHAPL